MNRFFDNRPIAAEELGEHQELLQLLAEGLDKVEPVPPSALEQAYGARFMVGVETELAELVFDSLVDKQPAMRNGGESDSRFLSFTNDHLTLDLSLLADGRTIVGELDPVVDAELTLEIEGGESVTVQVDQFGRFRTAADGGTFRLRVASHLLTQWITRTEAD